MLGVAILSVFGIAGLRHTGRDLIFPSAASVALILVALATGLRVGSQLGLLPSLLGYEYAGASLLWAGAFLMWLSAYLPFFLGEGVVDHDRC